MKKIKNTVRACRELLDSLTLTRRISGVFLAIVLGSLIFFASHVFAQTVATRSAAAGANLTFPIAQLGNCSSLSDCKTYCDDPTHVASCVAYAKEKGFYHATSLDTDAQAVLADAKATLGCDSIDSCRTFCQESQNASSCSAFAQKHNLQGGQETTSNTTLAKAETTLGCNSLASCQAFCDQESNKTACANFAKENGLHGGDETMGPGGCTSSATCKTFCSDPNNFQTCKDFVDEHGGSDSAKPSFTGPGGCTSEQSCQSFCDKNPTICHLNPAEHPAPMSATGEAHMQEGTQHGPAIFSPSIRPSQEVSPSSEVSYQKYCSEKGCLYNGTGCVCPPTPQESHGGNTEQNHPIPQQSFPTITPNAQQTEQPQPSTQNGPKQPEVEGATTHVNFFQWLMNQIFRV